MDYNALLLTTTEIGFQLLKNGAETYRVEESLTYVLKAYNRELTDINIFAIPSCVIVSFTTTAGDSYTKQKRVLNRSQNIDRIIQINSLCRYISAHHPDMDYINQNLRHIENSKRYPYKMQLLANCIVCFVFTVFYGGSLFDAVIGAVIGALLQLNSSLLKRFRMNAFTTTVFNSAMIAAVAILAHKLGFVTRYDSIIIACYMLLFPGVALTNAARDFIAGDVLSGTIRFVEALLVATSIALGSGITLKLLL